MAKTRSNGKIKYMRNKKGGENDGQNLEHNDEEIAENDENKPEELVVNDGKEVEEKAKKPNMFSRLFGKKVDQNNDNQNNDNQNKGFFSKMFGRGTRKGGGKHKKTKSRKTHNKSNRKSNKKYYKKSNKNK